MNYFNTQVVNELNFDFDDYFMQDIISLAFKKNVLTIKVVNRKELNFLDVKLDFASLRVLENRENMVLYSLYVNKTENGFQISVTILLNGQLHPLDFTAKEIEF